jgi:exopolyphosphatase/guanosine-5'-triphosphate,3'-diphosphate pyrophosphatase
MPRYATIDVGTNSVLLLVAERDGSGPFRAVLERAEITRLGRGVDKTRRLAPEGIEETVACVESFAKEARALGAEGIAVSATSAARDAQNGRDFLDAARARAGVEVEVISGELEAQLSFAAVHADFAQGAPGPLIALDIGGGSTELIYGAEDRAHPRIQYRHSFDVGSVRLTERFVTANPIPPEDRRRIRQAAQGAFAPLPPPPPRAKLVGVAGTVTTLYSVLHEVEPYDAALVQGRILRRGELEGLAARLADLSLEARRALRGLQPKRADIIPAGGYVLLEAMDRLGASECVVSDRGLRWGFLIHKFGGVR